MTQPLFASALSTREDARAAIDEVVGSLRAQLSSAWPDLVCVFVSHHYGDAIEGLGPALAGGLSARALIGCTGEGIVGPRREVESGPALAVWAAVLPGTAVRVFHAHVGPVGEDAISFTAYPQAQDPARAAVLMLADPFTFPADEYLARLEQRLPGLPVIGGMASGGSGPGQNLLIGAEGLLDGGALGAVIEGDVELCSVVSQGCRPVGKPWVITGCKENVVLRLGGKPALDILRETLQSLPSAEQALLQNGPFLGLAMDATKSRFERGDFLARGLVGIDPASGALAVADDNIRSGMTVQFLVRDAATAGEDLRQLLREQGGPPAGHGAQGALLFSCNGRGTRLFPGPDHDITCLRSAFPGELPTAGFFAMGEIGPVGGRNFLHGFTASVALFRARA